MDKVRKESPLSRIFDKMEKAELIVGGISLAALCIVVMIGIISRLINIPAAWYEETTRVFFLWMMWVGVGSGFNHSESSRVTVFVNMMPKLVQKICHALYYVLNLLMFAVLIVFGFRLAMQQFSMGEMGSALRIPMWIVGICVPIGSIFGFLGVINTMLFEPWRLQTTAEQLEADELAAKAREEFSEEEGGDSQ